LVLFDQLQLIQHATFDVRPDERNIVQHLERVVRPVRDGRNGGRDVLDGHVPFRLGRAFRNDGGATSEARFTRVEHDRLGGAARHQQVANGQATNQRGNHRQLLAGVVQRHTGRGRPQQCLAAHGDQDRFAALRIAQHLHVVRVFLEVLVQSIFEGVAVTFIAGLQAARNRLLQLDQLLAQFALLGQSLIDLGLQFFAGLLVGVLVGQQLAAQLLDFVGLGLEFTSQRGQVLIVLLLTVAAFFLTTVFTGFALHDGFLNRRNEEPPKRRQRG